jgi:hypothetical protein
VSPRASLIPLQLKSGLAAVPALRGGSIAAARNHHLSIDVTPDAGRTGELPRRQPGFTSRNGTKHLVIGLPHDWSLHVALVAYHVHLHLAEHEHGQLAAYDIMPPCVPAGLASPQLKSATGPGLASTHRESCLVLPNSPMAPAAATPSWQTQSIPKTPLSRAASPGPAPTQPQEASSSSSTAEAAPLQPPAQQQDGPPLALRSGLVAEYNYIK